MTHKAIRKYCLSLPQVTEDVKWGHDLCFSIGEKMFAVMPNDEGESTHQLSLKCTPEEFAYLTKQPDIVPAPYLARHHWVSFHKLNAVSDSELMRLLQDSYDLVKAKLPKKLQEKLG